MAINVQELFDDIGAQFRDLNGLHPGLWPIVPRLAAAFAVLVVVILLSWFFTGMVRTKKLTKSSKKK